MKAKILIVGFITGTIILAACKKDAYTTKPQLKFKSASSDLVLSSQSLVFTLELTDKEGDIVDSSYLYSEKISRHCADELAADSLKMPTSLPTSKDIKVDVLFTYDTPPKCVANSAVDDTCYFRFWFKDKAGNISDTVTSGTVIIR